MDPGVLKKMEQKVSESGAAEARRLAGALGGDYSFERGVVAGQIGRAHV